MHGSSEPGQGKFRRYPGVRSFEDDEVHRLLFRGRDRESYDLAQLVLAERLSVLFSRSGVGKSSIVNAGLMQPLRDDERFPMVVRVSGVADDPLDSLYRGVETACDRGIERLEIDAYEPGDAGEWNRSSLWHFFKTFYIWRGEKLLQPVVIIDQFEELFTVVSEEQRGRFIDELADLVRGRRPRGASPDAEGESELNDRPPDVKVVLAIREDFMADLEELAEGIPQILKSRFRLRPLQREQAELAIREPSRLDLPQMVTPPFTWSDEALRCTLDFLCQRKTSHGATEVGDEVEPFQLQLICQFVEDLVQERHLETVSGEDLGGEEALEGILTRFYRDSIDSLCRKFPARGMRRRLENLCEHGFITAKGRRLLREESTISESDNVSPEVLTEMVRLRLLRKEPRIGDNYYELTHDTLIAPILASREKRERRRRRRRVVTVGLFALVTVGAVGFAANSRMTARSAERRGDQRLALSAYPQVIDSIASSGTLQREETEVGTLTAADEFHDLVLEAWDVDLQTRQSLRISLSSTDFDPYLVVLQPNGEILTDDDSGGFPNSELSVDSDEGRLRIVVMSYQGHATGEYQLQLSPEIPLTRDDLSSRAVLDQVPRGGRLPGLGIEDALTRADTYRGWVLRSWNLSLEEPAPLTLELSSLDFDAYLVVLRPNGEILTADDSGECLYSQFESRGCDSRLELDGEPGEYRIMATSYAGDATGQYSIEVTGAPINHDDLYSRTVLAEISPRGELVVGTEVAEDLSDSDRFRGMNLHAWHLSLASRDSVAVELSSDQFDTYLVVERPAGEVLVNDDFGDISHSRLEVGGELGEYRIIVASYGGQATGQYRILVRALPAVTPP